MSNHPDASLTLREAFEKHYDKEDLSHSTLKLFDFTFPAWERLTGNPPVGEITNETLTQFRQAAIAEEYRPASINSMWNRIRSILRRLGPVTDGNPWALEILPKVPAMKPAKIVHRRPRMVSMEDLSRFYVACRHAKSPRVGIPPADWWRALVTMALTAGLRRGDLFSLRWDQIDLQAATMDFTARKTGKADIWPLHPVAVAHLRRLVIPGKAKVFPYHRSIESGTFYQTMYRLQRRGGVTETFGLHDLRRTGASLIEAIVPGLGEEFLQHAPRSVSDVSYLNRLNILRDALEKLPLPDGFRSGPKVAANREAKAREERQKVAMTQADFVIPTGPIPGDWEFQHGKFAYRGKWFPIYSGARTAILRTLSQSVEPVDWKTLCVEVLKVRPRASAATRQRISAEISAVRSLLRQYLGLAEHIDPIPCVQRTPAAWTLWIPNP